MGFFIKFILIFKIIDRLKLLNINFGPMLGQFLDLVGNILNLTSGGNQEDPDDMFYYTKTRGKLSFYQIDHLALYRMPMKYVLYMVREFF
jgi:hypothetical protein